MADFNHIPAVIEAMHKAASQIVRKAALDVEAAAKQGAPVRTGFLRSSIYTVTHEESSYGQGAGQGPLLPEIPKAEDDTTAYTAVGAEYGVYVELGTSKQAAQPYLVPAADRVRPGFLAAWDALEEALRKAAPNG